MAFGEWSQARPRWPLAKVTQHYGWPLRRGGLTIFTGTFARLMRVSSWAGRAAEERSQQLHYENFR
jgi:hypothetical protein